MREISRLGGLELREMLVAATAWLQKAEQHINALNVYPVPDGDCGTNMVATMRASLAEASRESLGDVAEMARAVARGALMGARGNSGVILSQIWRGLANGIAGKSVLDGAGLALALQEASNTAYRAMSHPVEGTILTVAKRAAAGARRRAMSGGGSLIPALQGAVEAARSAVIETPEQLAVLKEAGVVDAGGHGLYTLLEGALLSATDGFDGRTPSMVGTGPSRVSGAAEEECFGFCTQFLMRGEGLDVAAIRDALRDMGRSLIVVGDSFTVRVHIHALDPEAVKAQASRLGVLFDVDVRNMDEQHKDFLLVQRGKTAGGTAIVAVVNGDGLASTFSDLGVSAIVAGGQTMNPSTMDILQAIEAVPAKRVIVLPNNKNIILTAQQAVSLTAKEVRVVPTESVPQGVSALVAFVPEAAFEESTRAMEEAIARVRTIEISHATRATRTNGLSVGSGDVIGLLDGRLVSTGPDLGSVLLDVFRKTGGEGAGIVTIYWGAEACREEAEALAERLRRERPSLEAGVVQGGQPHYPYIISVE